MEKNIAGQIWIVYAWDETNHTAKAGNAANITANLRIDGAGANAVDDVNPTELENGYYYFDITQTESNGDYILICPSSATINIHVEGCPRTFTTTAPNYNKLGIESDGDLTKVNALHGHTVQTGDSFARIGAPVAANISADIAVVDGNADTLITRIPAEVAQKTHLVNGAGDITPPANKGIWDSLGDGTKSISGLHDFDHANDDVAEVTVLNGHTPQTGDGFAVVNHATHGNAKLVRSTTPANTLNIANGATEADLTYVMGTILTEGAAGRLAAALVKLLDVAAPVLTAESVDQSADNDTILAHADYGNAKLVRSTTPANKLDVSATGEAGLDFDNIKDATGLHTLTNITVPICTFNTDMRGTNNASNGAVWTIDRADDIEAIKVITDQISFDGSGNVQSSITRPTGAVIADAGNGASSFLTDLTESTDDYWVGGWVKFTSGNLVNQVKKVDSYNGTTRVLSFTSAYTGTPAGGDSFEIIVE